MAFVGFTLSFTIYDFDTVYPFLRKLIGFIHHPLPYLLLTIAYLAIDKIEIN